MLFLRAATWLTIASIYVFLLAVLSTPLSAPLVPEGGSGLERTSLKGADAADVCVSQFYAFDKDDVFKSQSFGWSSR